MLSYAIYATCPLSQFFIPQMRNSTPKVVVAAEIMQTVDHPLTIHKTPPVKAPATLPKATMAKKPAIIVARADG